jgi:hypothetical protein
VRERLNTQSEIALTGRALSAITEPLDHLVVDYHILCRNIATCVPGQENFSLNAEAFGVFIQMRNKIAHTGSGGITVTDTEIEQLLQFFRVFCVCLAQVVHNNLPKNSTGKR